MQRITATRRYNTVILSTTTSAHRYNRDLLLAAMVHTYDHPGDLNAVADKLTAGGYGIDYSTALDYATAGRECVTQQIEP
ncbi:hypothetical protein ACIBCR_15350 [Micromonospora echinospora]|uniref:hypothetical protein n=1 Tax=Micromonospora echinospora TaxID=1877 RepID=UPI003794AD60